MSLPLADDLHARLCVVRFRQLENHLRPQPLRQRGCDQLAQLVLVDLFPTLERAADVARGCVGLLELDAPAHQVVGHHAAQETCARAGWRHHMQRSVLFPWWFFTGRLGHGREWEGGEDQP